MAREEDIDLLIENSVALQKVLSDIAINLGGLAKQISELLALFKEASKSMSDEKTIEQVEEAEFKSMNEKLETLVEQNKTIAKGLILMESAVRANAEKNSPSSGFNF